MLGDQYDLLTGDYELLSSDVGNFNALALIDVVKSGTDDDTNRDVHPIASPKHCYNQEEPYEIVRQITKSPPVTYSIKTDSFSTIRDNMEESGRLGFDSSTFTTGGHKWALCIYPDGIVDESGKDHLSIGLEIKDELKDAKAVCATFRIFLKDQRSDTYLRIQEKRNGDPREMRFTALETEFIVEKALPINTLQDPSRGFLVGDCCVVGVDLFVMETAQPALAKTSLGNDAKRTFTWKIEKYSKWEEERRLRSPVFYIDDIQWTLLLYPKGDSRSGKGQNLSLYLCPHDQSNFANGGKAYAIFDLRIKNQAKGEDHSLTAGKDYAFSSTQGLGFQSFISLGDLNDKSKGFKVHDVVVVEVEIKEVFHVKAV